MKTGFLGLGAMGAHMARNLHRAGLLTAVWNRSTDKATALAAELGCLAPATPAQVAAACDVVVMCVSPWSVVVVCVSLVCSGDVCLPGLW